MENKKYDLEKAKEDCRRHEDALEEAQSCMCGHCHECGFDPAEMKAALDEIERLRSENKIISDRAAHHDRQDAKEIELLAARIAELEAGKLMYEEIAESYQIGVDDLRAYIKRLEAAFLEAKSRLIQVTENKSNPCGLPLRYTASERNAMARDALERIKAGGKDEKL